MTMTKFRVAALAILALASEGAIGSTSAGCNVDFTEAQLITMQKAWQFGKPHNLGYTLAAISWQESSAGENLINNIGRNYKEIVVGAYQNKIRSAGNREGCTGKDRYCYATVAYKLMTDQTYASNHTIAELYYWKGVRHGNMKATLASYHGGYSYTTKASQNYADQVIKKMSYLRTCTAFKHFDVTPLGSDEKDQLVANDLNKLKRATQ